MKTHGLRAHILRVMGVVPLVALLLISSVLAAALPLAGPAQA